MKTSIPVLSQPYFHLILSGIIATLVVAALLYLKRSLAKRASTETADPGPGRVWMLGLIEQTRWYFIVAAAFYAASFGLVNLSNTVVWLKSPITLLRHLSVLIMFVQAGLWGNWAITHWADTTFEKKREKDAAQATVVSMLKMGFLLLLWGVLILGLLSNLGFNITSLVAGLGIGGIAIALAIQKILGDLFSSISIIMDKPFVIGDFIIVGDVLGTVEHIGLKTTRLRSISGEQIVMPNSDLLESRIRNYRRMKERRVVMNLGVVYKTTADKLRRIPDIIQQIIQDQATTRFDRAHFKEFGPHSLNFEIVFWILDKEYLTYIDTQQKINLALVEAFEKERIEFAFPTQTVIVEGTEPSGS